MTRALIVDDSSIIQRSLSSVLTGMGCTVVACGRDGDEGVALYKLHSPAITILDVTMPNKDGRECLNEILQFNPKARVVMFSAINHGPVIAECLKLGALGFIDKALIGSKEALVAELSKYINEPAT